MEHAEYTSKVEAIIDSMTSQEIVSLHESLIEKNTYEFIDISKVGNDTPELVAAIKKRIQKLSIDDVRNIASEPIKAVIEEFMRQPKDLQEALRSI